MVCGQSCTSVFVLCRIFINFQAYELRSLCRTAVHAVLELLTATDEIKLKKCIQMPKSLGKQLYTWDSRVHCDFAIPNKAASTALTKADSGIDVLQCICLVILKANG